MAHPNRGGDGHVGHDILIAASGEPGEECARRLNTVLRISGKTNDSVPNIFRTKIGAVGAGRGRRVRFLHLSITGSYWFAHKISRSQ